MIWYTIILLDILQDPERLTHDDIDAIRSELQKTPAAPVEPALREAEAPAQPVQGEVKTKVGFVGGSLSDASVAEGLLDSVSNLSPPSFPHRDGASSAAGLVSVVQERLDELVQRLLGARNPREFYDAVVLVPSFAMQAFLAARFTPDVDLGPMFGGLQNITRIVLGLQKQKEHEILFHDQIRAASQSCVECWIGLSGLGLIVPEFDNWQQHVQNAKGRVTEMVESFSIEPVPAADLTPGRWMTPADRLI
jgi:hypothetical protein